MSREQDLLFCKIAISTGKVTQDAAQKCFALANRLETEGKKRPQVGAIFIKHNLLSADDAQRIYGAVQKRLQAHGVAAAPAAPRRQAVAAPERGHARGPAPRGPAARPPAARSNGFARPAQGAHSGIGKAVKGTHRASGEKIDPVTLWVGVAMLGVLIIVVVCILFLLLGGKKEGLPDVQGGLMPKPGTAAPAAPGATPAPAAPKVDANKALIEKAIGGGEKKDEAPAAPKETGEGGWPAEPPANGEGAKAEGEGAKAEGEGAKAEGEGAKTEGEGAKTEGEGAKTNPIQ